MKKSVLVLIALLIIVPGMAFTQEAAAKDIFRLAVSLPPANNAWQAKMLDSVLEEAAKDKDQFSFVVKSAVDDADQLNMLQTFMADDYDMIICLPGNGTLMTPICENIYESGTKLMIIDRPIASDKYTVLLAGNNYACGENAAKFIGDKLNGKGNIVILRSYVGIPIDLQRYNGFMDVMKKNYPGIKVLAEGDGEFNQQAGLKAMSNILPAYPKIDAVYTQDDETAIGALTAIENAGRKDIRLITGMGGSKTAYKMIKQGHPVFVASMSYFPTMGGDAVRLAKDILRGKSFKKDNISPTYVVTKDNVDKFFGNSY
jgi:ribose transport system substrate-binding protein